MTCREFKHYVTSLSLMELARTGIDDQQIIGHSQICSACDSWLQKQRTLSASLHALQAGTAGFEAGRNVEQGLLGVFRQGIPAARAAAATAEFAVSGVKAPMETLRLQSKVTTCSTPFAWRLSRFFEIGAYAAVAAAIAVAIFLGVHLLRHSVDDKPMQGQSQPERAVPATATSQSVASQLGAAPVDRPRTSASKLREERISRPTIAQKHGLGAVGKASQGDGAADEAAQTDADAGYMALMLCDPLSCASETQVVRMELPGSASAGQSAQPQTADVVVGYDGVVRAIRFVN